VLFALNRVTLHFEFSDTELIINLLFGRLTTCQGTIYNTTLFEGLACSFHSQHITLDQPDLPRREWRLLMIPCHRIPRRAELPASSALGCYRSQGEEKRLPLSKVSVGGRKWC